MNHDNAVFYRFYGGRPKYKNYLTGIISETKSSLHYKSQMLSSSRGKLGLVRSSVTVLAVQMLGHILNTICHFLWPFLVKYVIVAATSEKPLIRLLRNWSKPTKLRRSVSVFGFGHVFTTSTRSIRTWIQSALTTLPSNSTLRLKMSISSVQSTVRALQVSTTQCNHVDRGPPNSRRIPIIHPYR
eukprot:IDg12715t1